MSNASFDTHVSEVACLVYIFGSPLKIWHKVCGFERNWAVQHGFIFSDLIACWENNLNINALVFIDDIHYVISHKALKTVCLLTCRRYKS